MNRNRRTRNDREFWLGAIFGCIGTLGGVIFATLSSHLS